MSRLRGHRPETLDSAFDRRLTARPAVLAKTFGPDRRAFRPTGDGPDRTYPVGFVYFISKLVRRRIVEGSGNPCGFDLSPPAGWRGGFDPISSIIFGAVQRFVGRLKNNVRICFPLPRGRDSDADGHRKRGRSFFLCQFSNGLRLSRAPAGALVATVRPPRSLASIAASRAEL